MPGVVPGGVVGDAPGAVVCVEEAGAFVGGFVVTPVEVFGCVAGGVDGAVGDGSGAPRIGVGAAGVVPAGWPSGGVWLGVGDEFGAVAEVAPGDVPLVGFGDAVVEGGGVGDVALGACVDCCATAVTDAVAASKRTHMRLASRRSAIW